MPQRSTKTVTISYDNPRLIEAAQAKAKRLHMSFSGYVVSLIEKDLLASGDLPELNSGSDASRAASLANGAISPRDQSLSPTAAAAEILAKAGEESAKRGSRAKRGGK